MPGAIVYIHDLLWLHSDLMNFIFSILDLQQRKLRLRDMLQFAQDHIASKWAAKMRTQANYLQCNHNVSLQLLSSLAIWVLLASIPSWRSNSQEKKKIKVLEAIPPREGAKEMENSASLHPQSMLVVHLRPHCSKCLLLESTLEQLNPCLTKQG